MPFNTEGPSPAQDARTHRRWAVMSPDGVSRRIEGHKAPSKFPAEPKSISQQRCKQSSFGKIRRDQLL
ncbi:hypothetical protein D3C87_997670 [compost metagenome]